MDIKIVNDNRSFDSLKKPWENLTAGTDNFIYQTYDWNRVWWKHFGKEGDLYLILFYSGDELIGIVPLFWDTVEILGWKIYSCLRFIGSNISQPNGETLLGLVAYSDYLNLIVKPGCESLVMQHLADHFKNGNLPYDEIVLEEIPQNSMILEYIPPMFQNGEGTVEVVDSSSCANILLDNSWDDYMNRLSKRSRKKTRGYLNKVTNTNRKIFHVREPGNPEELTEEFETLVCLHQKQWNTQGFPGTFYEKQMYEFTREIAVEFFRKGWLRIKKLTALKDESCISTDMFFTYNKRIYYMHGGMNIQSPLLSKGAGHIVRNIAVKEGIENGYEVFDFMRGLQNYKLWNSDTVTVNKKVLIRHPKKKNKRSIRLVKKMVRAHRRIKLEMIRYKLFFRNTNFATGLRAYLTFTSQRIARSVKNDSMINICAGLLRRNA